MGVNNWSALDLRSRSVFGPFDDELICLHLIPKTASLRERFEAGRMFTENGKTWFSGNYLSTEDVAKLRKHYTVEWVHLPPVKKGARV